MSELETAPETETESDTRRPRSRGVHLRRVLLPALVVLLGLFVVAPVAGTLSGKRASHAADSSPARRPRPGPVPPRPPAEAIDLLGTAGAPVLKRLAPVLAGLAVVTLLVRRLGR